MKVLLPHPRIDGVAWWLLAAGLALAILLIVGLSALSAAPALGPSTTTINTLIVKLGDRNFSEREEAGNRLADIGLPAVRALRRAAADESDAEVRHRAQRVLNSLGTVVQTDRFLEQLASEDRQEREAARRTLATMNGRKLEALRKLVRDIDNTELGRWALPTIEAIRPERVETLIGQLADDDAARRQEAIKALTAIGKTALPGLYQAVVDGVHPQAVLRAKRLIREIETQKQD